MEGMVMDAVVLVRPVTTAYLPEVPSDRSTSITA